MKCECPLHHHSCDKPGYVRFLGFEPDSQDSKEFKAKYRVGMVLCADCELSGMLVIPLDNQA